MFKKKKAKKAKKTKKAKKLKIKNSLKTSTKSVEKKTVNPIPRKKPRQTIFLAIILPNDLLAKSVIKKAIGQLNAP